MSKNGYNSDHDELIQKYLDGELDGEEKLEADKLLSENPQARRARDEYKQISHLMIEAVGMEEVEKILEENFERIRQRAKETDSVPLWEKIRVATEEFLLHRKRVWIPAAATIIAAIWALVLVFGLTGKPPVEEPEYTKEKWSRVTSISLGANSSMVMEMEDDQGTKATIFWVLSESEVPVTEEKIEDHGTDDAETDK